MGKTRHIQKRMSQRSITERAFALVKSFGVRDGDKLVLNRKACDAADHELEMLQHTLRKARARGGLVLVESGDVLITTYALDSYSRTAANDDHYDAE